VGLTVVLLLIGLVLSRRGPVPNAMPSPEELPGVIRSLVGQGGVGLAEELLRNLVRFDPMRGGPAYLQGRTTEERAGRLRSMSVAWEAILASPDHDADAFYQLA